MLVSAGLRDAPSTVARRVFIFKVGVFRSRRTQKLIVVTSAMTRGKRPADEQQDPQRRKSARISRPPDRLGSQQERLQPKPILPIEADEHGVRTPLRDINASLRHYSTLLPFLSNDMTRSLSVQELHHKIRVRRRLRTTSPLQHLEALGRDRSGVEAPTSMK